MTGNKSYQREEYTLCRNNNNTKKHNGDRKLVYYHIYSGKFPYFILEIFK